MLADDLPPGLLDRFRLVALEAAHHVDTHHTPVVMQIKFFAQSPGQAVQWGIEIVKQEWRK